MQPMKTQQHSTILHDLSLQYELALALAHSIDLEENISYFMGKLIRLKNLSFGAVYVYEQDASRLVFAYPFAEAGVTKLSGNEEISLKARKMWVGEVSRKGDVYSILWNNEGYLAYISLGPNAMMVLGRKSNPIEEQELYQLEEIIRKFQASIDSCLVYQINHKQQNIITRQSRSYKQFFKENPLAMVVTDKEDMLVLHINKLFADLMEVDQVPENTTLCELFDVPKGYKERFSMALETGVELKKKNSQGEELILDVSAREFVMDDRHSYLFVVRDITKQRTAEVNFTLARQRLETLIQNWDSAILLEDENRKIVLVNKKFVELFGIPAEPEQILGADCSQSAEQSKHLFKDPDAFVKRIEELLKQSTKVGGEVMEMVDCTVVERDYVPIYLGQEYKGHLWQYRDITLKKLYEQELIEAREKASSAAAAKQRFLSTMSHEIRTPLNVILGMAKLLQNTQLPKKESQFLSAIHQSGDHLLHLINDILDYSRMEAGSMELNPRPVAIEKWVNQIDKGYGMMAKERGLNFLIHVDDQLPAAIEIDKTRLNQIIFNLLNNSLKFTQKGKIELEIIKGKGDRLLIAVKDTGKGIAKDRLPSIFDTFTQEDQTISSQYGGSGLGLSIVRQLVQLMGGEINVESSVGEGTGFYIDLPLVEARKPEENQEEQLAVENATSDLSSLKVLLAEDHEMNVLLVENILQEWGISIEVAKNGREAVDLAKQKEFDLILMDVQMPEMDGYSAMKEIRSFNYQGQIVALTANVSEQDKNTALESGFDHYLPKPLESEDLWKLLKRIPSITSLNSSKVGQEEIPFHVHSYILHKLRGNEDAAMKMVLLFVDNTRAITKEIEQFDFNSQANKVARQFHKLKSSFRMMGLLELADDIEEIEQGIKEGKQVEESQLNRLLDDIRIIINQIDDHFIKA